MIGGWIRRLRLRLMQRDEFKGITPLNTPEEWTASTPETRAFHWIMKKPLRYVARSLAVPDSWIENLDGNAKVLWSIIDRYYLQHEKQGNRRALLEPIIRYGVCLINYDNNYQEVADSILAGIIANRGEFSFAPTVVNPDNWWQDGRGRIEPMRTNPFAILALDDREVLVDRPLTTPVITTHNTETGELQYLALALSKAWEPYPGLVAYPIVSRGASVLDIAADLRVEARLCQ
jgi:hypothetical protein